MRVNWVESQKRAPHIHAEQGCYQSGESHECDGSGGEHAPARACDKSKRNYQAELRLVGQKPEQDARQNRAFVKQRKPTCEQGRSQNPVLAVDEVDEDGREGDREHDPQRISGDG